MRRLRLQLFSPELDDLVFDYKGSIGLSAIMKTEIGSKADAYDAAVENGPVENNLKGSNDDRLEGHAQPDEEDSAQPSAIIEGNNVRLKPLTDGEEAGSSGSQAPPGEAADKPTQSSGRVSVSFNDKDDVDQADREIGDDDSDSEELSAKGDSNLWDHLWEARMLCGKIVNNEYVQIAIISLILLNALMMGIATIDYVTDNEKVDMVFTKIDKGFLVIFTVEVAMQLFYLGVTLFSDGWLIFDLTIVVLSWSFESLQIVRAFRIFRAFRLVTRVKPLRDLVLAIGAVLPRMYAIAALLMLIFYIFSVLFTELFSGLPLSENYFGTLDASLFTCMEMMTLEWGEIAREVMTHEQYAWAPFLFFIAITGFIVFNLIVAVVCDAVAVTEKTVREIDGLDSEDPVRTLEEAQERIDLLQCHISDMNKTQQQVQDMIEMLAGELLHLESERMRAEHREAELRIKMERRVAYQTEMDSESQIASLERNYLIEKARKESSRRMRMSKQLSNESLGGSERAGKPRMRPSARFSRTNSAASGLSAVSGISGGSGTSRPSYNRDMSGRSVLSNRDMSGRSVLSKESRESRR